MFTSENGLYVAHGPNGPVSICGKMANRHGLVAGATGTGKDIANKAITNATSTALRTLTRSILGSLIK